jgi:hypothetical protein
MIRRNDNYMREGDNSDLGKKARKERDGEKKS